MCRGVSPTSKVRVLIQMSNPIIWAKNRLASEPIDVQAPYNEYWRSSKHEFTVASKSSSPTSPLVSDHERRGHHYHWKLSQVSLVSENTFLCEHYRLSLCNCPSDPTYHLRIDGLSALISPQARRIVKGVLPTDERIDRDDRGEHYSLWHRIRRGPVFRIETSRKLTPCS